MTAPIETAPAALVAGDVVRYDPTDRWCREGMAIATDWKGKTVLLDTYWRSSDQHRLTAEEIETVEFLFNLGDYDEMSGGYRGRHTPEKWETYAPTDRERITSQHGLQIRWFVRKGAQPDLATQIDNARQAVADAYEKLRSADFGVELAWAELTRLEYEVSNLPTWDDMSDLDKGAALLFLQKVDHEGENYAREEYPCKYLDDERLKALPREEANRHALQFYELGGDLAADEYNRLYDLALAAS